MQSFIIAAVWAGETAWYPERRKYYILVHFPDAPKPSRRSRFPFPLPELGKKYY